MSEVKLGVGWDERQSQAKAMSGDMVLVISPETVAPAPTSSGWTRTVTIELQDADGNLHMWFNKAIANGVSIADTSSAGTASIPSTTLTFEGGKSSVKISGDAADWLDSETDTLTVNDIDIVGYTVTGGTSVETFTTP